MRAGIQDAMLVRKSEPRDGRVMSNMKSGVSIKIKEQEPHASPGMPTSQLEAIRKISLLHVEASSFEPCYSKK